MVENFAFTPFMYFLAVPKAFLKDGVFKFKCIVHSIHVGRFIAILRDLSENTNNPALDIFHLRSGDKSFGV